MKVWQEKLFNSLIKDGSKRNILRICKELYLDDTGDTDMLLHLLATTILDRAGVRIAGIRVKRK